MNIDRTVRALLVLGALVEVTAFVLLIWIATDYLTHVLWGGWTLATRWQSAGVLLIVTACAYLLSMALEQLTMRALAKSILRSMQDREAHQ